ncbi:MAG: 2-amino-4-hydroxy-6-hydroxymethyldihydropteridine diphosphokinase [Gammaproteobacteria bacterium]|nr:2-amino-4-hydroxy-6-hydroxymethyldihydropteridine diphosphokinase [Gammaproteobacteria bacterium]
MPRVYVGIGSNIDRSRNVRSGVAALREAFGDVELSEVYEVPAVGFEGDPFFNLVAAFDTGLEVDDVVRILRGIEDAHQRVRGGERYAPRTLDIDLLLYGDLVLRREDLKLPRADVEKFDFVLRPLAEIAPEGRHPVTGRTFAEMWRQFPYEKQPVSIVPALFVAGEAEP